MIGSVTNSMCSVNYNVIAIVNIIIIAIVVVVGVTHKKNIDKYEIKFPYNLNIYISNFFFE